MKSFLLIWLTVLCLQVNAQLISGVEYFYDTDPGVGNGTFIAVAATANLNTTLSFPLGALSNGKHILGVRTKYNTGSWSTTQVTIVFKMNALAGVDAEYFVDTDPGLSNGIPISFPVVAGQINGIYPVPIPAAITSGEHKLVIRTKTSGDFFTLNEARKFTIRNDFSGIDAEYFIDTDPGLTNGIPLSFPVAAATIKGIYPVPIPAAITTGGHTLVIRSKTPGHIFGFNEARKFTIRNDFVNNAIEYFIDVDPGVGNGSFINIGAATVNQLMSPYSFNNVLTGEHILGFRMRTSNSNYSLTTAQKFFGKTKVAQKEYFIDVDPGQGNGTPIPVMPNVDSLDVTALHAQTGLSNGPHILVIRYKTLSGKWTLNEARPFTVDLTLAISLLIFSGKKTEQGNLLSWSTETEKNHAFFELMRSTDAINFYPITKVHSKAVNGNSNTRLDYEFLNASPPDSMNYYKLKVVDKDGNIEYSHAIRIDNRKIAGDNMVLYIVNNELHLLTAEDAGVCNMNLYDVSGKNVLTRELQMTAGNDAVIVLPDIAHGIYVVQLSRQSAPYYTGKIIY